MEKLTFFLKCVMIAVFTTLIVPPCQGTQKAPAYESPSTLKAAGVLSSPLRQGPHHQVDDEVQNDGYLNMYVMKTTHGRYTIHSTALLAIRVQEAKAIAELDELSSTEVFKKAALEEAQKPLEAAENIAEHPAETVKGIPSGVDRLFGRAKRGVSEIAKKEKEDSTMILYGTSTAYRLWAQKLGVDAYSSNEILRKKLKHVAYVDRLSSLAVGFVPSVPGLGAIGSINSLVWELDPDKLQEINKERMANMDVPEQTIDAFLEYQNLSLTHKTGMVAAFTGMEEVGGLRDFFEAAMNADSEVTALFYQGMAELISRYHHTRGPIARLVPSGRIVLAETKSRRQVILVPVDYLFWTEKFSEYIRSVPAIQEGEEKPLSRELWVTGQVSIRARRELESRSWVVKENARNILSHGS
jgi:hypothetical protein